MLDCVSGHRVEQHPAADERRTVRGAAFVGKLSYAASLNVPSGAGE
jgi:hypothetical protein